jgi:hypothetical protein
MGRRSRRRDSAPGPVPSRVRTAAPAPPSTPRPKARREDAPQAPWHPFPLVELAIFCGLVLIVVAFAVGGDPRPVLLLGGIALISIASLELAIREHFAGYKSHTTLLAAVTGLGVAAPLWWTPLPQPGLIAVFLIVAVIAFRALRATFTRRSGGLTWRA